MVLFDSQSKAEDRREAPRFPVKVKAIFKGPNNCKCMGKTENLSSSGALFDPVQTINADNLESGAIGSFALMIEENGQSVPIVVNCIITHFNERGMGIQFKSVPEGTVNRLEDFLMKQL